MEITKTYPCYEVWTIATHNPCPLNYSVYCNSVFCQPFEAIEYAKQIAERKEKYGEPCVWVGVFDVNDGVCFYQYLINPPPDIDETISDIGKVIRNRPINYNLISHLQVGQIACSSGW